MEEDIENERIEPMVWIFYNETEKRLFRVLFTFYHREYFAEIVSGDFFFLGKRGDNVFVGIAEIVLDDVGKCFLAEILLSGNCMETMACSYFLMGHIPFPFKNSYSCCHGVEVGLGLRVKGQDFPYEHVAMLPKGVHDECLFLCEDILLSSGFHKIAVFDMMPQS